MLCQVLRILAKCIFIALPIFCCCLGFFSLSGTASFLLWLVFLFLPGFTPYFFSQFIHAVDCPLNHVKSIYTSFAAWKPFFNTALDPSADVSSIDSLCSCSILYQKPLPFQEYKPYLFEVIRAILKNYKD